MSTGSGSSRSFESERPCGSRPRMSSLFIFAKCSRCDAVLFHDNDPPGESFALLGRCSHRLCQNCAFRATACPVCGSSSGFGRRYFSDTTHVIELMASVLCDLTKLQNTSITSRSTFITSAPLPSIDLFTFSDSAPSTYVLPSVQNSHYSAQPQRTMQQPQQALPHQPRAYVQQMLPIESQSPLPSEHSYWSHPPSQEPQEPRMKQEHEREQKRSADLERFKQPTLPAAKESPKKPSQQPPKRSRAKPAAANAPPKFGLSSLQDPRSPLAHPSPLASTSYEQPSASTHASHASHAHSTTTQATGFQRAAFPSSSIATANTSSNIASPTPQRPSRAKEVLALQREPSLISNHVTSYTSASSAKINSMTRAESRAFYNSLAAKFE